MCVKNIDCGSQLPVSAPKKPAKKCWVDLLLLARYPHHQQKQQATTQQKHKNIFVLDQGQAHHNHTYIHNTHMTTLLTCLLCRFMITCTTVSLGVPCDSSVFFSCFFALSSFVCARIRQSPFFVVHGTSSTLCFSARVHTSSTSKNL